MLLEVGLAAQDDTSPTRLKRLAHTFVAVDDAGGREIRSLDILHQSGRVDVAVVDISDDAVNAFAEVMRRHVGGHTYGDAVAAVYQQSGDLRRQHGRLLGRIVKSILEVDGVLVEVIEHLFGDLLQTRLGVTHGSGAVTVHRTKVTLRVHQGIAQRPPLGHTRQRVIDGGVAVRVVITHHFTHNLGGFTVGASRSDAHGLHAIQHTALHGLKAIAHIGKGT